MNNLKLCQFFISTVVDKLDPSTAKNNFGCITCPPPNQDPDGCTGKLTVDPPFLKRNIE